MTQSKFTPLPWLPEPFHIGGIRGIILSWLVPGSELPWKGIFERDRHFLWAHIAAIYEDEFYGDVDEEYLSQLKAELVGCVGLWHGLYGRTESRLPRPQLPNFPERRRAADHSFSEKSIPLLHAAREGPEAFKLAIEGPLSDFFYSHAGVLWKIILSKHPDDAKMMIEAACQKMNLVGPSLSIIGGARIVHPSVLSRLEQEHGMDTGGLYNLPFQYDRRVVSGVAEKMWNTGQWDLFQPLISRLPQSIIRSLDLEYSGQNFEGLDVKRIALLVGISEAPRREMFGPSAVMATESDVGRSFISSILRGGSFEQAKSVISLLHPYRREMSSYRDFVAENASPSLMKWCIVEGELSFPCFETPSNTSLVLEAHPDVLRRFLLYREASILRTALYHRSERVIRAALQEMVAIAWKDAEQMIRDGYESLLLESKVRYCPGESAAIASRDVLPFLPRLCDLFFQKMIDSKLWLSPECHVAVAGTETQASRDILRRFKYSQGIWYAGEPDKEEIKSVRKTRLSRYLVGPRGFSRLWIVGFVCSRIPAEDIEDGKEAIALAINWGMWSEASIISQKMGGSLTLLEDAINEKRKVGDVRKLMESCLKEHSVEKIYQYLFHAGIDPGAVDGLPACRHL